MFHKIQKKTRTSYLPTHRTPTETKSFEHLEYIDNGFIPNIKGIMADQYECEI